MKSCYRVMLGRKSVFVAGSFAGQYIGCRFCGQGGLEHVSLTCSKLVKS